MKQTPTPKTISIVSRPGGGKEYVGYQILRLNSRAIRIVASDLINREKHQGTSLGMLMKQFADAGRLVPDEHIIPLFLNEFTHMGKEGYEFIILDGFPRTMSQLNAIINHGVPFIQIHMVIDASDAMQRMLRRRRPGEDEVKCRYRQDVFEENTLPMILECEKQFPRKSFQIDALTEGHLRAREILRIADSYFVQV